MKYVCLLTDFGKRDGYPSAMNGVIYTIAPDAVVTDITHDIEPQNVLEGALTLSRVTPYYPPGTVVIAVVDPGVGTQRRPIAARIGDLFFVGPDNGLFSLHIKTARERGQPVEIVHLDRPQYWLAEVSNVFHGRDIFAPVGAHLANGVPLETLGTRVYDPVMLDLAAPQPTANGLSGVVLHVDNFGNLGTNIQREYLPAGKPIRVRVAGRVIQGLSRTFGDGPVGSLVALIDSSDKLAVAVVNGSAAAVLGAKTGDPVAVEWE